jgi:copper chaperone NosL
MRNLRGLLSVLGVMLLALFFSACAANSTEIAPPEIYYGQEVCEECGMIISEAKFAAATIDTRGGVHKFDDIGGMLTFHMDHPEVQVRAYFVHDYDTQVWLRAETAVFVESDSIHAPMGSGIAAFASREAAEQLAARSSTRVLTFDELRVRVHVTLHALP